MTESGVRKATGRERAEWFALLDAWHAGGRAYQDIVTWLKSEHGVSSWWAQKLVVEYQQERGLREPGVRPDGTFEVSVSRTIPFSAARAYEAIADPEQRRLWLRDGIMSPRTSRPARSARFDWGDGHSRVSFALVARGPARTTVAVAHARLPDAERAETEKTAWRSRLQALEQHLRDSA